MQKVQVSEVQIIPIKPVNGLIGFASCLIGSYLYIGSIGIHRLLDGTGYRLTYPSKQIGTRQINYFHPITREAGRAIELAIFAKCKQLFDNEVIEERGEDKNDLRNT